MSELCDCLGRSTYEELIEAIQNMRGCHDAVWENDDKASVFYYTIDDYLTVNGSLRLNKKDSDELNDLERDDHKKCMRVAELISSAVKKTDLDSYECVCRWENNNHIDIEHLKVGMVIRYSSFVSTSVNMDFTFNKSKERRLKILKPAGSYVADYSKYYEEQELLIDKGAMFIVREVSVAENTITLQQISIAELNIFLSDQTDGEVA